MGEPERHEDEDAETPDQTPAPPKPPARPDWLVGASEALETEFTRPTDQPDQAPPGLRSAFPQPPRAPAGPRPPNPYEGFAQSAAGRSFTSNWMDTGYVAGGATPSSATPAPDGQDAAVADPEPEADVVSEEDDALAGPETPTAAAGKARWSPPPPPPKPWWEPWLAQARTPAGMIAIGVAVVLLILLRVLFGPKDYTVSLARVRHHAREYDGQTVKLNGKVGDEVYPVGGGYSFYLLQGRDTIVVFTRSRTPVPNQRVSVSGTISTGVLNGELRQALLENSPTP